MVPEAGDPVLGLVLPVLGFASVAVWFALANRLSPGPILAYEPRRPVPWHGGWTLLPIAMVVMTLGTALTSAGSSREDEDVASAGDMVERIAAGSATQPSLVVAFLAVMIVVSEATPKALGFPKNPAELARDIRIG